MLIKNVVKRFIDLLPVGVVYIFLRRRESMKRTSKARKRVKTIYVQHKLEFDVYWKSIEDIGAGPGFSIFVCDIEVLRFDCYGKGGHYHIFKGNNLNNDTGRLSFSESGKEGQIRQSIGMVKNLQKYLAVNQMKQIKRINVDPSSLAPSLNKLESTLMSYV